MPMPMSKSKGSEMPKQRQSPRVPLHQRSTSSSESNSANRPIRDRSPKLEGRRSPRSPLPEAGVCNQKKRGSRAGELETRLGLAKEELKKLKEQLLAAENAKKEAELELEEARKLIPIEKKPSETEPEQEKEKDRQEQREGEIRIEESNFPSKEEETSIEEVVFPIEAVVEDVIEIVEFDTILMEEEAKEEPSVVVDSDKNKISDITVKTEENSAVEVEIKTVKKDLEICVEENSVLKKQLEEAKAEAVTAKDKEVELSLKVSSLEGELEVSRSKMGNVEEKLRSTERAKMELETEMKLLRVQTDQWRKAADAAAAILSVEGLDVNTGSTTMAERCVSMEHNFARGRGGSGHEKSTNWHYKMLRVEDAEVGLGNGKRKSGGIRMFGDLWKKRGQQK